MNDLILTAWGGDVRNGEECFLFDKSRFLFRRIARATLVQLDHGVGLLADNRVYSWMDIAKTEAEAKRQLLDHAHYIAEHNASRLEIARAFIEANQPQPTA